MRVRQGVVNEYSPAHVPEDSGAVCLAGGRHAMGGQQFRADATMLDMRRFNKVLRPHTPARDAPVGARVCRDRDRRRCRWHLPRLHPGTSSAGRRDHLESRDDRSRIGSMPAAVGRADIRRQRRSATFTARRRVAAIRGIRRVDARPRRVPLRHHRVPASTSTATSTTTTFSTWCRCVGSGCCIRAECASPMRIGNRRQPRELDVVSRLGLLKRSARAGLAGLLAFGVKHRLRGVAVPFRLKSSRRTTHAPTGRTVRK